jgi:hypothetical protein
VRFLVRFADAALGLRRKEGNCSFADPAFIPSARDARLGNMLGYFHSRLSALGIGSWNMLVKVFALLFAYGRLKLLHPKSFFNAPRFVVYLMRPTGVTVNSLGEN